MEHLEYQMKILIQMHLVNINNLKEKKKRSRVRSIHSSHGKDIRKNGIIGLSNTIVISRKV